MRNAVQTATLKSLVRLPVVEKGDLDTSILPVFSILMLKTPRESVEESPTGSGNSEPAVKSAEESQLPAIWKLPVQGEVGRWGCWQGTGLEVKEDSSLSFS